MTETVEQQLREASPPLRGGEIADWGREAGLLVERAREDPDHDLDDLVALRLDGVPLGYVIGWELFLGDKFAVEPGVVIPHPATELLALLAVRAADMHAEQGAPGRLLEIGVGVGAVGVSVRKRRPSVEVHATELSGAALRLTRLNAQQVLGGLDGLRLYQAYVADDVFSPFARRSPSGINVVVSNPPYLAEGDEVSDATKRSGLAHLSYSPTNDPNWFLREVLAAPPGLLADGCSVLMECAEWYLPEHDAVMREAGWQVEIFDRDEYVSCFGPDDDLRPMEPTAHRVMHAWRGGAEGLGGLELDLG